MFLISCEFYNIRREWKRENVYTDCLDRKMEKTIPGAPENEVPVHLRKKQVCSET